MSPKDVDRLIEEVPTKDKAKKLLKIVMDETSEHTKKWLRSYDDLDYLFLERGFDIGGFQSALFLEYLKKHGVDTVDKIGSIFQTLEKQGASYLHSYPRQKASRHTKLLFGLKIKPPGKILQFLEDLDKGKGGEHGKQYFKAIISFFKFKTSNGKKISKGLKVWEIIWAYCWNCRYLRENYDSSFKKMIRSKAEEWLTLNGYDENFIAKFPYIKLERSDWEELMLHILENIRKELKQVGKETAAWILRDVQEFAEAGRVLMKFNTNNRNFLLKTGLLLLPVKEGTRTFEELREIWSKTPKELYIDILTRIRMDYDFPSINRNIYDYTSREEAKHFGYCRTQKDCKRCKGRQFCLSGKMNSSPRDTLRKVIDLVG